MPIETAEGIRVPAISDNYALTTDLRLMAESIETVVPVPNVTARTALVSALVAAGRPPSLSNPLYVDREDAAVGLHLERTSDGTNWEAFTASTSSAVPMLGVWTSSSLTTTANGSLVTISGVVATSGGTVPAGAWTDIGVVVAGMRPAGEAHGAVSGFIAGHALPYAARGAIHIAASGNLSVYTETLTTTCYVSLTYLR